MNGSLVSALTIATHSAPSTSTNGDAAMIVRFCRLLSAVSGSPSRRPGSSMRIATAAVSAPHSTTSHRLGSSAPFSDMPAMTIEAESAPVMKKIEMRTIATNDRMVVNGSSPNRANSCRVESPSP